VDKFDFESGLGSAAPKLPPRTFAMAAGMNVGVRPFLPPKVWDSGDKFHPAAKELAAIDEEANATKRPVGSPVPAREVELREEPDVKLVEFDQKILSPAAFEKFKDARETAKATPTGRPNPYSRLVNGDNVKVIPLGTSSALPSKYRNGQSSPFFHSCDESDDKRLRSWTFVTPVSGYLIRIPNHGSILLEAGEGTWGQMCRFFGTDPDKPDNVWDVLRDIRAIFVSHAHGDHHFGLSKILAMRKQVWFISLRPLMWLYRRYFFSLLADS